MNAFRKWAIAGGVGIALAASGVAAQQRELKIGYQPFPIQEAAIAIFEKWGAKNNVKIVKVLGDFTWHAHADTDELFLVLDGRLTIQMRGGNVTLAPGEIFVVPRGADHCPRADVETAVLLLEPRDVVNTGSAGGPLTAEVETLS
jgi:mannose-6-phosphate isomerase-like protein (cupin superfamily)